MTQLNDVYHHVSYPSQPQTRTYQNQMSINSSPPRHSDSYWEWSESRTRRRSESDAALGLANDFAGIGSFERGLAGASNDLDNQEFAEALELSQATDENDYVDTNAFISDEFGNRDVPGQENGLDDAAMVPTIVTNTDHDFLEEADPTTSSFVNPPGLVTFASDGTAK
jgi:hypothetical protein